MTPTSPLPLGTCLQNGKSCLERPAPSRPIASGAPSSYTRTPSEWAKWLQMHRLQTSPTTDEIMFPSSEDVDIHWRGARTQPQTPLIVTVDDSSLSLPTDYEFRAELVDDGVGGAIARVRGSSSSISFKSPSLFSNGFSSPISYAGGSDTAAVFPSRTMLRSASLPIPRRLSYESFEAGLIATERLAGSVALAGEAQPFKMSPAAKCIVPLKGFNYSTSLTATSDRRRSISDSHVLQPYYSRDAFADIPKDEEPSFEVEDPSLSFSGEEDSFSCPSPALGLGSLGGIELLGVFGIVVDENEAGLADSLNQPGMHDPEKENREPGITGGTVKTPSRLQQHRKTSKTTYDRSQKPIPIVDDRSPLSDRSAQISSSATMDLGTPRVAPVGRLLYQDVPPLHAVRNTAGSTSSHRAIGIGQPPSSRVTSRASGRASVPSSTRHVPSPILFQEDSEEILYIPPQRVQAATTRVERNAPSNLLSGTTRDSSAVDEQVRLRRSGGFVGVIGEEVRNVLARSTSSTSSAMRSSKSSLGDLTVKASSPGGQRPVEGTYVSQRAPEPVRECCFCCFVLSHLSESPLFVQIGESRGPLWRDLSSHFLIPRPPSAILRTKSNDLTLADLNAISPGRTIQLDPFTTDNTDQLAPTPTTPPELSTSPVPDVKLAHPLLRRVSIRRVSQEPSSSLPAIAEMSICFSSPPVSPSAVANSDRQTQSSSHAFPPTSSSTIWSLTHQEIRAVKLSPVQFAPLLPPQIRVAPKAVSTYNGESFNHRWEHIPNRSFTEDRTNPMPGGMIDWKWVYDLEDRNEMEAILDFAHRSRFLMDLEDRVQLALDLGSVFDTSVRVAKPADFARNGSPYYDSQFMPYPPAVAVAHSLFAPTQTTTIRPLGPSSSMSDQQNARGWPDQRSRGYQNGGHGSTSDVKFSTAANHSYSSVSADKQTFWPLYSATPTKVHGPSAPLQNTTTTFQANTPRYQYTTASKSLQSVQSQAQAHSSASLPPPLLTKPHHTDRYPYSSYVYTTPHPHSSDLDHMFLQHQQPWNSPCGPRFLSLRHSATQRHH
ncbi:hypothetical protein FRC04_000536 [Tulasnella sp. 424]|nr:hypothetical protein FRC04_000536 [Tulasnella sp. 424]KAG8966815.1 hypothetical protein FRC05_002378 [Tulasnella sp. 425]